MMKQGGTEAGSHSDSFYLESPSPHTPMYDKVVFRGSKLRGESL